MLPITETDLSFPVTKPADEFCKIPMYGVAYWHPINTDGRGRNRCGSNAWTTRSKAEHVASLKASEGYQVQTCVQYVGGFV